MMAKAKKEIDPAVAEFAKEYGAEVVAWHPNRLAAFLTGTLTLAELEGISKDEQYKMAETGYNLMKTGKLDDAKKIFEALKVLEPYDAFFHMALGSIAHQSGDMEEAAKHYSRAIEVNQRLVPAYANRGEIHLLEGRIVEALSDFLKAIEHDPGRKNPHSARARVFVGILRDKINQATQKKAAG